MALRPGHGKRKGIELPGRRRRPLPTSKRTQHRRTDTQTLRQQKICQPKLVPFHSCALLGVLGGVADHLPIAVNRQQKTRLFKHFPHGTKNQGPRMQLRAAQLLGPPCGPRPLPHLWVRLNQIHRVDSPTRKHGCLRKTRHSVRPLVYIDLNTRARYSVTQQQHRGRQPAVLHVKVRVRPVRYRVWRGHGGERGRKRKF